MRWLSDTSTGNEPRDSTARLTERRHQWEISEHQREVRTERTLVELRVLDNGLYYAESVGACDLRLLFAGFFINGTVMVRGCLCPWLAQNVSKELGACCC